MYVRSEKLITDEIDEEQFVAFLYTLGFIKEEYINNQEALYCQLLKLFSPEGSSLTYYSLRNTKVLAFVLSGFYEEWMNRVSEEIECEEED